RRADAPGDRLGCGWPRRPRPGDWPASSQPGASDEGAVEDPRVAVTGHRPLRGMARERARRRRRLRMDVEPVDERLRRLLDLEAGAEEQSTMSGGVGQP